MKKPIINRSQGLISRTLIEGDTIMIWKTATGNTYMANIGNYRKELLMGDREIICTFTVKKLRDSMM